MALGWTSASEAWGREALALYRRVGDRQTSLFILTLLSRIALQDQRPEQAGRLWGAAEIGEQTATLGWWLLPGSTENRFRDQYISPLLSCRDPAFERGRADGHRMPLDDAINYALSGNGTARLAQSGSTP